MTDAEFLRTTLHDSLGNDIGSCAGLGELTLGLARPGQTGPIVALSLQPNAPLRLITIPMRCLIPHASPLL